MKRSAPILLSALMVCALTGPALAAENGGAASALYPVEITEYTEGEHSRLNKVYALTAQDDPAAIPTADFVREGYAYTLLDLTRQDLTETEHKPHTESVTVESESKDREKVMALLAAVREVMTEDGYAGTLALDADSIQVKPSGYGTSSRTVTATRSYPNLSDADTALVPKTTEDNGRTLTLADVQWQEAGGFYHATATYTGTASSRYATGYTVTADYTGEVAKTVNDTVLYTAMFSGTPIQPEAGEKAELWKVILPVTAGAAGLSALAIGGSKRMAQKKRREYN